MHGSGNLQSIDEFLESAQQCAVPSAYYPHVYLLPDGRILVAATTEDPIVSEVLDLNASAWTSVGGQPP